MELRHLRYFVTVAEKKHFTKAAELLGIAQPPLSQQIKKLEHEIGVPLIHRLTRGIELTVAGEIFYNDAKRILNLADEALDRAKTIARGESGQLRLGFACSTVFTPIVLALLQSYRERYPNVVLSPIEAGMSDLMVKIQHDKVDAAFVRLPCKASESLKQQVLMEEEMMVVLPLGHRLGQQSAVNLQDLADEWLITFPREFAPGLYDSIIAAFRSVGVEPKLGQQSPQLTSGISMVMAGFGVSLAPFSLTHIESIGVTYHSIGDVKLTTKVALAWRYDEHAPVVLNLAAKAKKMVVDANKK